jgi:hypothetical protein
MITVMIAIASFILLVVLLVLLRAKTDDKFQIKNSDIVIALIPVVLALFLSGKVQELTIGEFKIVLAVQEAAESPISAEVTELPVEEVLIGESQSLVELKQYIEKRIQVVSFQLSKFTRGGSNLIVSYLELTQYPFLRFIVFNNPDGSFFGMADAQQIAAMNRVSPSLLNFETIADWVLGANEARLKTLPGFVSAEDALYKNADKLTALKKMNSLNVPTLPVIDESDKFAGIIEQNKLAANMLTDILEGLKATK